MAVVPVVMILSVIGNMSMPQAWASERVGWTWGGGKGVPVCYPAHDACSDPSTGTVSPASPETSFQCVELALRYWKTYHLLDPYTQFEINGQGIAHAYDLWTWVDSHQDVAVKYADSSLHQPVHGDLIVMDSSWGSGFGHVAVVDYATAYNGGYKIIAMEENYSSTIPATYIEASNGTMTRDGRSGIYGTVHAKANFPVNDSGVLSVAVNPTNAHQFVFWLGSNGHIWETWYAGGWHGPQDMGWTAASAPSVAVDDSEHQYVFWLGTNGHIHEATYTGAWSGDMDKGWAASSGPGVGVNPANGHVFVFWIGTNGTIHEAWNSSGSWMQQDMGWTASTAPSVAVDDTERQIVVWRGKTNSYIYEAGYSAGIGWVGPTNVNVTTSTRPAVAYSPATGAETIYYRGATTNHIYWIGDDSRWSYIDTGWTTSAAPSFGVDGSDFHYIFWEGATNNHIYESWDSSGVPTGPRDRGWTI